MKTVYWGSVALLFTWLFVAASSLIPIDQFDTALRLLASHYVSQGLILYKDIGIVYPPGMAWMFGLLIPFGSIAQYNALSATAFLIISLVVCRFWGKVVKQNTVSMAFLFLALATFVRYIPSEPFSLLLTVLLCVVHMYYLEHQQSKALLVSLGLTSAALAFFRWDTGLLYIFVMGGVAIFQSVLSRTLKKDMYISLLAIFAGYLMAISLLFFVFSGQNIVDQVYNFIITIPTQVILPFRRLPLPGFQPPRLLNAMIYVAGFVYLIELSKVSCWFSPLFF